MTVLNVAIMGAGQRGADVYGEFALLFPHEMKVAAVADPDAEKRRKLAEAHGIPEHRQFESWERLLEQPKLAEAVIIATPDTEHYEPAAAALQKGYHVLLEKPMSTDASECVRLGRLSREHDQVFMISHVLRYTPFFSEIKRLLEEGAIGELMSIQHNENIGYDHFAHSYVRGNWRNSKLASPVILAKSSHDMDILLWLSDSSCEKVASFGELSHFRAERAPKGAGSRCLVDCRIEQDCAFSARKIYLQHIDRWPATVISTQADYESKVKALLEGPYGKCVYACDNDVMDHQVTILQFKNGVTATFHLSAFTNEINRTIKLMGTKGEIHGNMGKNEIVVKTFDPAKTVTISPALLSGGHWGGDTALCRDFVQSVRKQGDQRTSADRSVEGHLMAFAAEASRIENRSIRMEEFTFALTRGI